MAQLWDDRYQPADADIIRHKAYRMVQLGGIRKGDREDVEQELALHVFQQTHKHDEARRPRGVFISVVVKHKLLNLIEKSRAKKRDDRSNVEYGQGPEGWLIDGSCTDEQIDLLVDLKSAVESMPPELRQAWELRLAGHNEAALQGLMNLTRAQVRTLMQRIARHLREAGLEPAR